MLTSQVYCRSAGRFFKAIPMKWFKHMSNSRNDIFMQQLFDEFGHMGTSCWWMLIETVAENSGHPVTGKITIPCKILARNLRTSQTKARQLLRFCQTNGKVLVEFFEKSCIIEIPNMLNIKDNYAKDLQETGKRLAPHKNREEKKRTDKRVGTDEKFDLFWAAYPKKVAKKYARKAWDKLDVSDSLQTSILSAIKAQRQTDAWQKDKGQFIPHPTTWLNGGNWDNDVGGNGKPERTPEELATIEQAKKVRESLRVAEVDKPYGDQEK